MLSDRVLKDLGRAYRQCLNKQAAAFDRLAQKGQRPDGPRGPWIGREAEKNWVSSDLKKNCGVDLGSDDAISADAITAVSNLGDPRRTDAVVLIAGETVEFELKKSDYGGTRAKYQLASQVFDLGLGSRGATALYVIYGENGRIDVYSYEDAKRVVDAELANGPSSVFEVPTPRSISF
jgi:hypothetical protein